MFKQRIQKHSRCGRILSEIEKTTGKELKVERSDDWSEYDPDTFEIRVGSESWGESWPNRILFHGFGHAVLDSYWAKFDQAAFEKLFLGKPSLARAKGAPRLYSDSSATLVRPSVTGYGRSAAEEAWAEAFSFLMSGREPEGLSEEVMAQLEFAQWVIQNIEEKRAAWGKFKAGFAKKATSAA